MSPIFFTNNRILLLRVVHKLRLQPSLNWCYQMRIEIFNLVLNFTIEFTLLCTKLSMCYMCALLLYILTAGYQISPESTWIIQIYKTKNHSIPNHNDLTSFITKKWKYFLHLWEKLNWNCHWGPLRVRCQRKVVCTRSNFKI